MQSLLEGVQRKNMEHKMDSSIRSKDALTAEQNRAATAAAPVQKDATVEVKGCVRYPGKIQDDSAPTAAPAPKL